MTFTVPLTLSGQQIADQLTTLIESGDPVSRGWCHSVDLELGEPTGSPWYADGPLFEGLFLVIFTVVDETDPEKTRTFSLTPEILQARLPKVPHRWLSEIADDQGDARIADLFWQYIIYGSEVFA